MLDFASGQCALIEPHIVHFAVEIVTGSRTNLQRLIVAEVALAGVELGGAGDELASDVEA